MPDQKGLVKTVRDMNIPAGKEFGDALDELTEAKYKELADSIPEEQEVRIGNSLVKYKMVDVSSAKENIYG